MSLKGSMSLLGLFRHESARRKALSAGQVVPDRMRCV
jgi:hypothetical protein